MALSGDGATRGDLLDRNERYYMSHFLLGIPYPPAQRRAYNSELSEKAEEGFELFHLKGNLEGKAGANVCGNCHRMPFWVSTNTPGNGMDAPTWRGAYERFLIFPQGRFNIIDFNFFRDLADRGSPEREVWQLSWQGKSRFDPVWDMVLEGSTGFSGSFARQLTLNQATWNARLTEDLLSALEASAREGAVVLQVDAFFPDKRIATTLNFRMTPTGLFMAGVDDFQNGTHRARKGGKVVGTFTGRHGIDEGFTNPGLPSGRWVPSKPRLDRRSFPCSPRRTNR